MIRFLFLVLLSQPVLAQVTFTTLGDITLGVMARQPLR